jgi:hypothetical protein
MSSKIWKLGAVAVSATMLGVIMAPAAQAGSAAANCVGSGRSISCVALWGSNEGGLGRVVHFPRKLSEEEQAASADRDRKWAARCQPALRYDDLGVVRYTYTASGCEFGRHSD